jgi:hypothetical protein
VKVIAALVPYLPNFYTYRIIFMRRAMPEILASQRKMLINRSQDPNKFDDAMMTSIYAKHLELTDSWMDKQTNLQRIDINYNELLINPGVHISRVNQFVDGALDVISMQNVIDASLYRQRGPGAETSK